MNENPGEILFEYLRNILFSPDKAFLDVSELPPDFKNLGEGMSYLEKCVVENRTFLSALAKGNFTVKPPSIDNPIAAPAKALQGSLRHIAWQTSQVAKGDYGQQVNFMGEFSENFNLMVKQLDERTSKLEKERFLTEEKNKELTQIQDLFLTLVQNSPEVMVLLDVENNYEYVLNNSANKLKENCPTATDMLRKELWIHSQSYSTEKSRWDLSISVADDKNPGREMCLHYNIDSYPMYWNGRRASAHIIRDCTAEVEKEQFLMHEAFNDQMTGMYNRRYAMTTLGEWYDAGIAFCISMLDVDHLKYCNDVFGHESGDEYILSISRALEMLEGDNILCRIGGDEFLVIAKDSDAATQNERLGDLRARLMNGEFQTWDAPFTQSFSFGTCANIPVGERTLNEILKEADVQMYQYKSQFKPKLKNANGYKDDRVSDAENARLFGKREE